MARRFARQRKRKGASVAPSKTAKQPRGVETRPLQIAENELDFLLKLVEQPAWPYKGMRFRLQELKEQFRDELAKYQELLKRRRGNAFWVEESLSAHDLKEARKQFRKTNAKGGQQFVDPTRACMSAKQLRELLKQERLQNNVKRRNGNASVS